MAPWLPSFLGTGWFRLAAGASAVFAVRPTSRPRWVRALAVPGRRIPVITRALQNLQGFHGVILEMPVTALAPALVMWLLAGA